MLKIKNIFPVSNIIRIIILVAILYAIPVTYTYENKLLDLERISDFKPHLNNRKIRYILRWTPKYIAPFHFMGDGTSVFIKNKCQYTNCFVTDNRTFFANPNDFDAIVFNVRQVEQLLEMTSNRSLGQKYIFGAMESADNFPVCNPIYDGFFNWTWTYKLDSDFRFGYITIYDLNGTAVGPAVDMKWPNQLDPITDELKETLSKKTKAGAWFVSNCKSKSNREIVMTLVIDELKEYNLTVDVYGACGKFKCSRKKFRSCIKLIKDDYYFYFSFENSFAEDYVTEKLLTALNNYAIPVVFGAADYTRVRQYFNPGQRLALYKAGPAQPHLEYYSHLWSGSLQYQLLPFDRVQRRAVRIVGDPVLCDRPLGRDVASLCVFYRINNGECSEEQFDLIEKMNEIISNKTMFYDYFRWTNHYVYRDTSSNEDICKLCEMMNNEEKFYETSEWPNFRSWWNGARYEMNCKK